MADTFASRFRKNEEILEVQSALREERGVVVKEKREPYRFVFVIGEYHFGRWIIAEKRFPDILFRGDTRLRQPLVFRELLNEGENERSIALGCRYYSNRVSLHGHGESIQLAASCVNDIFSSFILEPDIDAHQVSRRSGHDSRSSLHSYS
jgi:hypothetical protein